MPSVLHTLASAWHRGTPRGIYSVCSAHPWAIEAAIEQALADGSDLLLEATSNQVNHLGGYTGMCPEHFKLRVLEIAKRRGLTSSRIILGGDHLGPNPWQHLPSEAAMREAEQMVQAYIQAGFQKIHLDASMPCADDGPVLDGETIAWRAAALCSAAESAAGPNKPLYVIGTEVPTPGGATESLDRLRVTTRESAAETLATHRRVFKAAGLGDVWPRVFALVVQPGVEFNNDSVVDYVPARARHLRELLNREEGFVYEAHSTDYQRPESYRDLVRDGFAILKVGPALTFAMRECLVNLALIEDELIDSPQRSCLMGVLDRAMTNDHRYWEHHYRGAPDVVRLQRIYSYSDRVRYYWNHPEVKAAIGTLMSNLRSVQIPETLISNFLPDQYTALRARELVADAQALVIHRVRQVLGAYSAACNVRDAAA